MGLQGGICRWNVNAPNLVRCIARCLVVHDLFQLGDSKIRKRTVGLPLNRKILPASLKRIPSRNISWSCLAAASFKYNCIIIFQLILFTLEMLKLRILGQKYNNTYSTPLLVKFFSNLLFFLVILNSVPQSHSTCAQ